MSVYFAIKSSNMSAALKIVFVVSHLLLIGGLLLLIFQGPDVIQEKLFLSLVIFTTLNLIRLLQKVNRKNPYDQL